MGLILNGHTKPIGVGYDITNSNYNLDDPTAEFKAPNSHAQIVKVTII